MIGENQQNCPIFATFSIVSKYSSFIVLNGKQSEILRLFVIQSQTIRRLAQAGTMPLT